MFALIGFTIVMDAPTDRSRGTSTADLERGPRTRAADVDARKIKTTLATAETKYNIWRDTRTIDGR